MEPTLLSCISPSGPGTAVLHSPAFRDGHDIRGQRLADAIHRTRGRVIHPVHAVVLASSLPLFFGALLSDCAYSSTYAVQGITFAAWLNAGAMVFAVAELIWATLAFCRDMKRVA